MATDAQKKEALERTFTEEEILYGLTPEARVARQAGERYKRERRSQIYRDGTRPTEIARLKDLGAFDAERGQLPVDAAAKASLLESRAKVIESMQEYKKTDNQFERMKLALQTYENYLGHQASVASQKWGADSRVIVQKLENLKEDAKQLGNLLTESYPTGITHKARGAFLVSMEGQAASESPVIPLGSEQERSMLDSAKKALDMAKNDPAEQARILRQLDAVAIQYGADRTISAAIIEARGMSAEDLRGQQGLKDLVATTGQIEPRALQAESQINQLQVGMEARAVEIDKDNATMGGGIGNMAGAFDLYRKINKEMDAAPGTLSQEAEGDKKGVFGDPVTDWSNEQINLIDEQLRILERPAYTNEYQRARAQAIANPYFQDYMDLRGFTAGQEDEALRRLGRETKPILRRMKSIRRLSGKIDVESPEKKFLGIKMPMTERRKEALRMAKGEHLTGAPGDPTTIEKVEAARKAHGLDPEKTMFQAAGIEPVAETPIPQRPSGQPPGDAPSPETMASWGRVPRSDGAIAIADAVTPTDVDPDEAGLGFDEDGYNTRKKLRYG